jgi:O-antigen/teichoic acid export membrane protein
MAPRYLAPEAFGAYATAYSFIMIFRILPDLGMAYASTLEISREPSLASRLGSSLIGLQLVLAAATVLLCVLAGGWLYRGPAEHVVWVTVLVLSVDLVLKTLKGTLRWLLKGLQHFGTETASLVLERSLLLLLGFLALRHGYGAVGFALVLPVVRLPDTLGLWAFVDRFVVRLRPAIDPALWKELVFKGVPFAYAGIMVTLLFNADKVILEHLRGQREAGFYGTPVQILEGLTLIPRVLSYAFLPTMAALWVKAPGEVTAMYRRGLKYLLLVGLPVGIFGILSSASFIPLLFGEAYVPSIPLAKVLIPVCLLMFVSNFSETTLFCINRWKTLVLVSTIGVAVDVVLALVLIPELGALGAAWARVAGEGAYTLMTAGALAAAGHRPGWVRLALRPLACAVVFGLALRVLTPQGLLISAASASVLWVVATFVLGVWDKKEKDLARGLLARIRGA